MAEKELDRGIENGFQAPLSSSVVLDDIWKGENEDNAEPNCQLDSHPLSNAGIWTELEVEQMYRQKLVKLRDLYRGQLGRMRYSLKEKRRQFLLQWQSEGGQKTHVLDPPVITSTYDAAVSNYGKASGEVALLQRKRYLKRLRTTCDMLGTGESCLSYTSKRHAQLMRLKHRFVKQQPCSVDGCIKVALPLTSYCKIHILQDLDQYLYTGCTHLLQDGSQCGVPVLAYKTPPHCHQHASIEVESGSHQSGPSVSKKEGQSVSLSLEEKLKQEKEQELSEDPLQVVTPSLAVTVLKDELVNVTSPISTDSLPSNSQRNNDKLIALFCSESEAESTDREKD